jgi:hypothetical protein
MFNRIASAILLAGVAAALPAFAGDTPGTPVLSGSYVTSFTQFCQPNLQATYIKGSTTLANINLSTSNYGQFEVSALAADFDSSTKTVTFTGSGNSGTAQEITDNNGTLWGLNFVNGSVNQSYSYSNTSTTLTINGTDFQIVYGALKKGVAQSATAVGINGAGCSVSFSGAK